MRRRDFIAGLGSAAAGPLVVRAQQTKLPVIGHLIAATLSPATLAAFHEGLAEHGYVEGRNVAFLDRLAEGEYHRLPVLAAELVSQNVAVLVTSPTTPAALAAQAATQTIPIVFLMGSDPVEYGLVRSLARPGGNITGFTNLTAEVNAKRLDLLHELVPTASTIALIANPLNLAEIRETKRAADTIGVRGALLVGVEPFFWMKAYPIWVAGAIERKCAIEIVNDHMNTIFPQIIGGVAPLAVIVGIIGHLLKQLDWIL